VTIEEYKATIENMVLKNVEREEEIIEPSCGEISDIEKVEILARENRKLHVRCDMLEEELRKIREFQTNPSYHPCI
jgi:hypothetical protein